MAINDDLAGCLLADLQYDLAPGVPAFGMCAYVTALALVAGACRRLATKRDRELTEVIARILSQIAQI